MLQRLRTRLGGEDGFTLIELLVVVLIIGILAAIAIPSFLNQRGKGEDAAAKSGARTAQTAFETYYTDAGSYDCGDDAACKSALRSIENELPADRDLALSGDANGYTVTVTSRPSGRTFTIRKAGGTVTRTCDVSAASDNGGCRNVNAGTRTGDW